MEGNKNFGRCSPLSYLNRNLAYYHITANNVYWIKAHIPFRNLFQRWVFKNHQIPWGREMVQKCAHDGEAESHDFEIASGEIQWIVKGA